MKTINPKVRGRKFVIRRRLLPILCCLFGALSVSTIAFAQETEDYGKDASTEINVKNADIAAVVRIFSKKTKRNYILDERVKGKISIYLPGRVSSDESIKILDSVLQLKGFTSVPIGENLWKIVPAKEAIQSTIPTVIEDEDRAPTAAMVTRLLQLKYVGADDAKQLLTPLVSAQGLINAYTGTNSLIIIDSEDNIQRLEKIVASLDIPSSDSEMTIIPIEHADSVEISEKLNEILGEEDKSSGNASSSGVSSIRASLRSTSKTAGGTPAIGSTTAEGATISARSRAPKIIPDERTNSIIVVADEETSARIRALISELDSPLDKSGERYYVYRCRYADAEELADVLGGLSGQSTGGTTSSNRTVNSSNQSPFSTTSTNSGSRDRGDRFGSTQDRLSGQRRTPGRSRRENSSTAGGATSVSLGENISISADPSTNSLIIFAGKTDYQKILQLLKELDVKRRQVLVEAMLLEVAIDDSTLTNIEWLASAGGDDGGVVAKNSFSNNLATLISDPVALSNFSVAAATSGTLTLPGNVTVPTQTVLINAAQTNSSVNVLSAPNILATDNEQAEIIVGQNVPFLASTSTSGDNLNNTFNQIDRQDVGITLRMTPQISSDDFVRLEIFTEVSSVIAATLASDLGPTTTLRTSETVVTAKDGQMIVTGGLMSDEISDTDAGVPFLKDIPVLGHIFRNSSSAARRTNLLIFITPRIIRNQFDARDQTLERTNKTDQVIDFFDLAPDRDDVLKSDQIDNVVEARDHLGEKPTTIRPAPSNRSPEEITEPADSARYHNDSFSASSDEISGNDEEVIEMNISPKFSEGEPVSQSPEAVQSDRASFAGSPDARTGEKSGLHQAISQVGPQGGRFIVAQMVTSEEQKGHLPFTAHSNGLVGIVVPPGSNGQAKDFFQVGALYHFLTSSGPAELKPVGVFASIREANELHPEMSLWHTLSPHEVMNLGKGPWMRER